VNTQARLDDTKSTLLGAEQITPGNKTNLAGASRRRADAGLGDRQQMDSPRKET
jgi:hypothetical protein